MTDRKLCEWRSTGIHREAEYSKTLYKYYFAKFF